MAEAQYPEIERLLADSRALTDVPEAHGTLAGALCAASDYRFEDWLREIYAEGRTSHEVRERLEALFEDTRRALAAGQMQFDVMLPGDEVPIADRASALGQWCQGFLYGLGTSPIPDTDSLPDEVAEIVRDLTSITQVAVDARETDEANEQAYTELVEFVRVGAQLLFDELARFRGPSTDPGAPASGGSALH
jgi:yecA family protein